MPPFTQDNHVGTLGHSILTGLSGLRLIIETSLKITLLNTTIPTVRWDSLSETSIFLILISHLGKLTDIPSMLSLSISIPLVFVISIFAGTSFSVVSIIKRLPLSVPTIQPITDAVKSNATAIAERITHRLIIIFLFL